jgi:uncharacterized protein YjiS (DUF1127 family)
MTMIRTPPETRLTWLVPRPARALAFLFQALRRHADRIATLRALDRCPNRALRDIGHTRADIDSLRHAPLGHDVGGGLARLSRQRSGNW